MNRSIDFQFPLKIESGEILRAIGHVTMAGEFRLSHVWDDTPSGCLHYSLEYRKGVYTPKKVWAGVYDTCPEWLIEYANSEAFRKVVATELQRISRRFARAAARQPDASEGGAGDA